MNVTSIRLNKMQVYISTGDTINVGFYLCFTMFPQKQICKMERHSNWEISMQEPEKTDWWGIKRRSTKGL